MTTTTPPATVPQRGPKLLQQLRIALRVHHYSRRTEKAYLGWVRRYVRFHGLRHPGELGAPQIREFLVGLAVREQLSASSQTQALSALVFLYREVLRREPGDLGDLVRAKQPGRLPVVLTREEVRRLLDRLDGVPRVVSTSRSSSGQSARRPVPQGSRSGSPVTVYGIHLQPTCCWMATTFARSRSCWGTVMSRRR